MPQQSTKLEFNIHGIMEQESVFIRVRERVISLSNTHNSLLHRVRVRVTLTLL